LRVEQAGKNRNKAALTNRGGDLTYTELVEQSELGRPGLRRSSCRAGPFGRVARWPRTQRQVLLQFGLRAMGAMEVMEVMSKHRYLGTSWPPQLKVSGAAKA